MKKLKLIFILLIGGVFLYYSIQSQYHTIFFEGFIKFFLTLLGLIVFIWSIVSDSKSYTENKNIKCFSNSILCAIFSVISLALHIKTWLKFDKPSLLKVYYNGDFNGTGIDFKTDGTYIFDSSAVGMSDYFYGTYSISGNKITMDRDSIENHKTLRNLELKTAQFSTENKKDLYLYEVDDFGNLISESNKYRLIKDNRKSTK